MNPFSASSNEPSSLVERLTVLIAKALCQRLEELRNFFHNFHKISTDCGTRLNMIAVGGEKERWISGVKIKAGETRRAWQPSQPPSPRSDAHH
jgi:hypothetical protein